MDQFQKLWYKYKATGHFLEEAACCFILKIVII